MRLPIRTGMRNRAAKRHLCGFLGVDVYELKVVGRVGELIDAFLSDLQPLGRFEFRANELREVFYAYSFSH